MTATERVKGVIDDYLNEHGKLPEVIRLTKKEIQALRYENGYPILTPDKMINTFMGVTIVEEGV